MIAVQIRNTIYFNMSGYGSLGYWHLETSHSSSHHFNYNGISDDEILEVFAGDGRRGHRSLNTIHYPPSNRLVYHSGKDSICGYRYQETSHYSSRNCGFYHSGNQSGENGRVGYRSQEIIHYSSRNCGSIFYVDGRGGNSYQTRHSSSHNPGVYGRF